MRVRIVCDKCKSGNVDAIRVANKETVVTMSEAIERAKQERDQPWNVSPPQDWWRLLCLDCGYSIEYDATTLQTDLTA